LAHSVKTVTYANADASTTRPITTTRRAIPWRA
jgi:hypothetical protein